MNKYHKYKSELASSLPSWVKLGALAMGVGVGGWALGSGLEKVWAGNYGIELKKGKQPETFLICGWREANSKVEIEAWKDGYKVLKGKPEDVFVTFHSNKWCFAFVLGDFHGCYNFQNKAWHVYGGTRRDSLHITSNVQMRLPKGYKFLADVLYFDNISAVEIGTVAKVSVAVFSNCDKVDVVGSGSLVCDGIFVSDTKLNNSGRIRSGCFWKYGDSCLLGKGSLQLCPVVTSTDVFSLDGLNDKFEESGFFTQDDNVVWSPYEGDGKLPVAGADGNFCKISSGGKYCFVFVCKIKYILDCDRRLCFSLVKDGSGEVLGMNSIDLKAGRWNFLVCPVNIVAEDGKVWFRLLDDIGQVPNYEIDFQNVFSVFVFKVL